MNYHDVRRVFDLGVRGYLFFKVGKTFHTVGRTLRTRPYAFRGALRVRALALAFGFKNGPARMFFLLSLPSPGRNGPLGIKGPEALGRGRNTVPERGIGGGGGGMGVRADHLARYHVAQGSVEPC